MTSRWKQLYLFSLGTKALNDANVSYTDIEQACVGYVYGLYLKNVLYEWDYYHILPIDYC